MSTILTSANPHVSVLDAAVRDAAKSVEWLVIAHNDPRMLQSLNMALTNAAILEISQDTWDFENGPLAEALEWALEELPLKNVMLVGNSQSEGGECRAEMASEAAKPAGHGYERLIAGVQSRSARNRGAQQRFEDHVRSMKRVPTLRDRSAAGDLAVHTLFYRAESGLFLAYDADAQIFRPLVA